MTTRRGGVQACNGEDARARLRDARAQLDLAELAGTSTPEERKAAVSCAVIAGIAAADAACRLLCGDLAISAGDGRRLAQPVVHATLGGQP